MAAELARVAKAFSLVEAYIRSQNKVENSEFIFETRLVWFCYILGGWKALVSTDMDDHMYYEVTYNREKDETYLDAYEKVQNICFPGSGPIRFPRHVPNPMIPD